MYNGVINVFKERGYTSNDVVQIIKKLTRASNPLESKRSGAKVGHTGTLDPDATGVLPICLGRTTKLADYIMASDKEYVAKVVLGTQTSTGDAAGEVVSQMPVNVTQSDVLAVLPKFIGELVQVPPMYSAIKVDGKKLYEYARAGIEIDRKKRNITIQNIEILRFNMPGSFVMRVNCSKGTYIRTLCEDIGTAIGTAAHMGSLIRTRSGNFTSHQGISLEQLKLHGLEKFLTPPDVILAHLPKVTTLPEADKPLSNGNKISLELAPGAQQFDIGQEILLYDSVSRLVGIFSVEADILRPKVIL